ncbi:MAG: hypothetical protein H0X03_06080 [Nitrosopumilus sp.]|nr:hypothetical protein [Nitrosopumilus sp.]
MSENNFKNKKNKELDPNNDELNLQKYNSNDKDIDAGNQTGQNQSSKQQNTHHNHDDSCTCD